MKYLFRKTNVAYEFSPVNEEGEETGKVFLQDIDYDDRTHSLCELARQVWRTRVEMSSEEVAVAGPSIWEFNTFYEQYVIEKS
ncbi:MAG: hypothetical protein KKG75_02115 [Nanoarchaeota archaeon]|nr:hypothetical protein [Nanoarchaeota archaeon]